MLSKDIILLLHHLASQDSRDHHGRALLQMECRVPALLNLPYVNLLLYAGADPNDGDLDGNGPLHFLASSYYDANIQVIASAARLLLSYGAHLDKINKNGDTAAQVWVRYHNRPNGGVHGLPDGLRQPRAVPKLKCLSARIVSSENIQYGELTLPVTLHSFVKMH